MCRFSHSLEVYMHTLQVNQNNIGKYQEITMQKGAK